MAQAIPDTSDAKRPQDLTRLDIERQNDLRSNAIASLAAGPGARHRVKTQLRSRYHKASVDLEIIHGRGSRGEVILLLGTRGLPVSVSAACVHALWSFV